MALFYFICLYVCIGISFQSIKTNLYCFEQFEKNYRRSKQILNIKARSNHQEAYVRHISNFCLMHIRNILVIRFSPPKSNELIWQG